MLQETKFLCDTVENALRVAVARHSVHRNIALDEIQRQIPAWDRLAKSFERDHGQAISIQQPISDALLAAMTFHQLTTLIKANWNRVSGAKLFKRGFADLFWHDRLCRDVNAFGRDMDNIRDGAYKTIVPGSRNEEGLQDRAEVARSA
jgi:hypothetical protein